MFEEGIGEREAAQKTVDQYSCIMPRPFPDGKIPLVIAGFVRGNLSETIPAGEILLGDPAVPYYPIDESLTGNSSVNRA
jgi:hypothetical protein